MSKKVCILTTHHPATDARIFYKEARSLQQAGYDVSLIAPLNKDGFLVDSGKKPIAELETVIEGIKIIGFKLGTNKILDLRKIRIIASWLRLGTIGTLNFGFEPFSDIIDKGIQIKADVYHCHEIWSLYVGIQIKRMLAKKGISSNLVYDVHEFSSARHTNHPVDNITGRIVAAFERKSLDYVDYVITANYITRGYLLSLNRFIKTEVLDNCPDMSIFQEAEKKHKNDVITICHEGMLHFNRGLREMLEVMNILKGRYGDKVRFLIIGDVFGEERKYYEEKVKEYGIEDIVGRTGWLPYTDVGKALSQCSIGVIFMQYTENNMLAGPPNKLYNYMRYGLPVVTVDLPETRRIILESQCGVIVKNRKIKTLVDAMSLLIENEELRDQLGENARNAIYEKYNWGIMGKKLLRVYKELDSSSNWILQTDKENSTR
jgi:glycosyltransferase involved in cell wall biosynthesis